MGGSEKQDGIKCDIRGYAAQKSFGREAIMRHKKMLYIMGIEWNWIYQRPQIFAEHLQKNYELTVVCPKQLVHPKHQDNTPPDNLIELLQIPFQEKIGIVGWGAGKLHRHLLGDVSEFDLIWVGYPLFGRYIPDSYKGTVIYDCMDNFEALYPDRREAAVRKVCREEERLLKRADIVFASSEKLRDKMLGICPGKKINVVRNGCGNTERQKPTSGKDKTGYKLGYIGTISEWFDSRLIEASISKNLQISYEMIGPVSNHQPIQNERVTYRGVVEHSRLGEYVKELDGLLMPFVVNEIILYVDPVKLYEYIAWGKCIIASWYPEIERFRDFVYFYRSEKDYLQLINDLAERGFPAKYSKKQQEEFLRENTWEARADAVRSAIDEN